MQIHPGDVYRHDTFYLDEVSGEWKRKYLVVLATLSSSDLVARLLTSRPHGRPENPRCFHGHPFPSYFLGVPGGNLGTKTWVDLKYLDDIDELDMQRGLRRGIISKTSALDVHLLIDLLECAAGADDTTHRQEQAMRDLLARLR